MTRNRSERTYCSTASTVIDTSFHDDTFANLPDLSKLKDNEKQHILNVLGRDENLRSKHLSRFMQLRKEVTQLEQNTQPILPSSCARCHTVFGLLFNTGAMCPKCGERVCKQCRLMYNVNDSGWLCILCCKQMQLLSYSGEWIYSIRSNLRKDSLTASEVVRKSLTPSVSIPNLHQISSSDTEPEDADSPSSRVNPLVQLDKSNQKVVNIGANKMIVQTTTDEQKLKLLKRNSHKRPVSISPIQSGYQRSHEYISTNLVRGGSSDDVDSLFDQSPNYTDQTSSSSVFINANEKYQDRSSSTPKSTFSLSKIQNQDDEINHNRIIKRPVDCESVTSSEWGGESEKGEPTVQQQDSSKKNDSKRSLSSHIHLGSSIQSIREVVNRIPRLHPSASRTSINSQEKVKSEVSDTTSSRVSIEQTSNLVISDTQSLKLSKDNKKSNSLTKLSTINNSNSNLKSNNSIHESSNTLVETESIQRDPSITDTIQSTNNAYRFSNNNNQSAKGGALGSVGNLHKLDSDEEDDDDDIDRKFEKAKIGLANRTASCLEIHGSQASINSLSSEKRARYGLDISGTIELKLTYTVATGALDVTIIKCTNLAKAKRNQTSDPYVKLYLLPDRSKNGKRRSSTKKNTIDPVIDEKFRYHVTKQEFETRVLWISVWSEATIGPNDFLGEIQLPLSGCTLDKSEEHVLVAQKKKKDLTPTLEPTLDPGEIQFQLSFIENPRNKDLGTLQVHYIQCKAIYHGKNQVEASCKGLLMPDRIKRKIPGIRQGPTPKWDVPLRWDGVRYDNLENSSIEISIWCQERFRKFMIGFVRLNLAHGHFANKAVAWSDSTKYEKAAWERFISRPTIPHTITLPLRPALGRTK